MLDASNELMKTIRARMREVVIEIAHNEHGHPCAYDSEIQAFLDHINTAGTDGAAAFMEVVREDTQMFNPDNLTALAYKIGLDDLFGEGVSSQNTVHDAVIRYISQWPLDMARWYEHVDQFFREETE